MTRRIEVAPLYGLGHLVVVPDVLQELSPQVGQRREHAARNDVALDLGEPEFDLVEPRGRCPLGTRRTPQTCVARPIDHASFVANSPVGTLWSILAWAALIRSRATMQRPARPIRIFLRRGKTLIPISPSSNKPKPNTPNCKLSCSRKPQYRWTIHLRWSPGASIRPIVRRHNRLKALDNRTDA